MSESSSIRPRHGPLSKTFFNASPPPRGRKYQFISANGHIDLIRLLPDLFTANAAARVGRG